MGNGPTCGTQWGELLPPRGTKRVVTESALSYGLILAVIWTPRPLQRWLWWVAAAAVVFMTAVSFDGAKAMGLRAANLLRSSWVIGVALLIAGAAVATAAGAHTLHVPPSFVPFVGAYFAYAVWSFVQQFLLQSFFLLRFLRLFPAPRGAALFAAVLFALAHLPNPVLVPVTFLWGLAACRIFLRYRNLYPLALAHAIFGIVIAITVPGHLVHNMRVGLGYLTYSRHLHELPSR
ncbi:MAG TPA: CPBP family glutamic-type intramembrane protease [Terracidiphilus sp.]|nr:CPBP family glutamic-type intramembrane protease [Terracidiphilus sp.]